MYTSLTVYNHDSKIYLKYQDLEKTYNQSSIQRQKNLKMCINCLKSDNVQTNTLITTIVLYGMF